MRFSSFNGLWYLSAPNGLQLKFNPLRGLFLPTLFHSAFPTAHSSLVRQPFHYQNFPFSLPSTDCCGCSVDHYLPSDWYDLIKHSQDSKIIAMKWLVIKHYFFI